MRRNFFKNLLTRNPDQGFWPKGGLSQNTNGELKFDHPMIADPSNPNVDGSYNIKWQATSGKGAPTNPSKPVDSNTKITGDQGTQNMVIPTTAVDIDPKNLNFIQGSEAYLDEASRKHAIYAGGGQPSDYLNGDKYIPPGQIG